MSGAALFEKDFLRDPNAWKFFVPAGFIDPRTLDPNYIIPNRSHLMTGFTVFNIVVAFLMVVPRLYSRLFVVRSFKLDDWLIIPAYLSHIASTIIVIYGMKEAGLGKHVWDCTPEEILTWYRVQYWANIITLTTIFITRASILCFIKTIVGNAEEKSRIVIMCVQVVNGLIWPGTMFPTIFMCTPEFRNWSLPVLVMSKCIRPSVAINIQKIALGMGVSGVMVDFAILFVPIRTVWKLRLPVRQRIIVSGLFAVGGLACIASICKAYYISVQLSNTPTFDLSWTFVDILASAEFEQTLALVTACGPGLKPLISRALPIIRNTFRGASKLRLSNGSASPPYSREGKAELVTIGGGGKKKKNSDLSEVDSATSMADNSDDNSDEGLWKGDLESGQGVVGVPSVWQGEAEGSWQVYHDGTWRGGFGHPGREQVSVPLCGRGD